MDPGKRRSPWLTLALLVSGAVALTLASWLADQYPSGPLQGAEMAALLGIFFVLYTWALMRALSWREARRIARRKPAAEPNLADQPGMAGTIYGLIPGREYRVLKSFTDFHGGKFEQGDRLHFKERHFLPYHGGHTIVFAERSIYLQQEQDAEILANFSHYLGMIE